MSSFKILNLNFLKSLNSIGDKIDEFAFTNFVQSTLDIHIKQKINYLRKVANIY